MFFGEPGTVEFGSDLGDVLSESQICSSVCALKPETLPGMLRPQTASTALSARSAKSGWPKRHDAFAS